MHVWPRANPATLKTSQLGVLCFLFKSKMYRRELQNVNVSVGACSDIETARLPFRFVLENEHICKYINVCSSCVAFAELGWRHLDAQKMGSRGTTQSTFILAFCSKDAFVSQTLSSCRHGEDNACEFKDE